jgi:hypothetical protein
MKTTISKPIGTLLRMAALSLVLTGCEEENVRAKRDAGDAAHSPGRAGRRTAPVCAPIPDSLQVPAGNRLVLQAYARGVQVYQVRRSAAAPNVFEWAAVAPVASLYAKPNFTNEVMDHYRGPSWEFTKGPAKGEKVVAARLRGVTRDATAIPWLLLKTVDSLSTANNQITFVQRICTTGGLAPTTGADAAHLGALDSIPYTATYLFYAKSDRLPGW